MSSNLCDLNPCQGQRSSFLKITKDFNIHTTGVATQSLSVSTAGHQYF